MKKICLALFILTFVFAQNYSFAAIDNAKLVSLSKEIINAKDLAKARSLIDSAKDMFFSEHGYDKCVDFLNSLVRQRYDLAPVVNYYIGLTRYTQLKYLEESQSWDEYFSKGNDYREEITEALQKTIQSSGEADPISVYSRLILYRFHQDQNDTFAQESLDDLMSATRAYAQKSRDFMPIKDVAAQLSAYDEKSKARELYKLYAEKIASSNIGDSELRKIANDFYKEGNLELAEDLFDISKVTDIKTLIETAKLFIYRQNGLCDPAYAEKIFKKIEELFGKNAFDEELLYARAYNLEKAKEYAGAKDVYLDLLTLYPGSKHAQEAEFKVAIITTYYLRDIDKGREFFQKLADKNLADPYVVSALYQLGLFKQWEEDLKAAEGYYNKLLDLALNKFQDTVALAKLRLEEMNGGKPIENNLKTFLDISFKGEKTEYSVNKVGLICNPYMIKEKDNTDIKAEAFLDESGCLQPELKYLWSGHIGSAAPSEDLSGFATTYPDSGTKEINLVIISSGSILGHSFDMVDVSQP